MPYPQQPQQPKSGASTAVIVIVIVLGCIVVFGGILAVLAIFGVRSYLAAAKSAEAINGVGTIARMAESSYSEENPETLCASATQPVPDSITMVAGKKYQSTTVEWSRDAATNAGFSCLKFDMSMPQYYQYDYKTSGSASRQAPGDGFRAIAKGDLDGDGNASEFSLAGKIDPSKTLVLETTVTQVNPKE